MTPEDPRLRELLLDWEEHWEAGTPVSPEELCAGLPQLLDTLQRHVELLRRFRQLEQPEPYAAAVPAVLGRYTVKRELGRGFTGVVYLAKDHELRRKVAVKVLSPAAGFLSAVERRRLARRFEREAQTLAQLHHPAIVPVFEARLSEGEPYFVMEYLSGGSLKDRLKAGDGAPAPADAGAVAAFMARVADAVHYAHAKGIVHRDLKPANILLDADGRPKVSDFGLAKLLDDALLERQDSSLDHAGRPLLGEDSSLTLPGRQPGTPAYMAPEQFDPRRGSVGLAADIWALGTVLYELLTGRRPFRGDSRFELQRRICAEAPPPPAALNPHADAALARLALRCLHPDAARRPTAAALASDLAHYRRPGRVRRFADAMLGWWFRRRGQSSGQSG